MTLLLFSFSFHSFGKSWQIVRCLSSVQLSATIYRFV